jgi:TonB family protein
VIGLYIISAIISFLPARSGFSGSVLTQTSSPAKERPVWVTLYTKEVVTGQLIKVDPETIDLKVQNSRRSISLEQVKSILFTNPRPGFTLALSLVGPSTYADVIGPIEPMSEALKPTILYSEKARYTEEARQNKAQGEVILKVVYQRDGRIGQIEVEQGLPDGLTESAIEATRNIRFIPAMKNGAHVSVQGSKVYKFNLY